jgi:DNA-binding YbaB/EbfC family protein
MNMNKKKAQALQQQLAKMQEAVQAAEGEGSAGNGLVTMTLNGNNDLVALKIKPECVDPEDVEGLEDLIKAAYEDAIEKVREKTMQGMGGMPGLGDMGFPF